MGTVRHGTLELEAADFPGTSPLPRFRDFQRDRVVSAPDDFPSEWKELLGYETGGRMLPYRNQDRYDRNRSIRTFPTIILENDFLCAEFVPRLGGRLWSLYAKKEKRELLYRNNIFQPANLAIRNAWFSGGIEWNIGQYGHAFSTCEPVFCSLHECEWSGQFLRIYDYERCHGLLWHIDFHLPDDSPVLVAHVVVENPEDKPTSMYYWTNIAVPETQGTRIFSQSAEVITIDPFASPGTRRIMAGRLPHLSITGNTDVSYPARIGYSDEYFFQNDAQSMPWEAALEDDGSGLFEISIQPLRYRKMFCWGTLNGGRQWQRFLGGDERRYIEIQAGLAPTQLHGLLMPARTQWRWTQMFGLLEVDSSLVHGSYKDARVHVAQTVSSNPGARRLKEYDEHAAALEYLTDGTIISQGSGWGALENERRRQAGLSPFSERVAFPVESMDDDQKPYLMLLRHGCFPPHVPSELPWHFLVSPEWEGLLKTSLVHSEKEISWNVCLHLGVIAYEKGAFHEARSWWTQSVKLMDNAWAWRNLALWEKGQGHDDEALACYEKAWRTPGGQKDQGIAEELFTLLIASGKTEEARIFFKGIPQWMIDVSDVLAVDNGRLCVREGDAQGAETVLRRSFANIREGETPLTDIWFGIQTIKSLSGGKTFEEAYREVVRTVTPPESLDFRML
ncbi:DUF5107 domain-containing protein [Parasphaerochaeta coccoides]|uniref:Tetratricopeptide TPR_4 n=1 Tax=Parasphaerochaeta coccoides (strain ATCC BAA-1237 / DSM 17374 / SPN1) TaxID=760011 RepID=F4GH18_PARC1|nr:DUF5107 domain-containing protein [Parasphaerochaeta coccoides]AEC01493.1 tetratricopeptide TPR_4 [Parasphaerochaeta coccoides DSM 17374]